MAYSIQRVVSDGTLALLDITISYIERAEIAVLLDGVNQPEGSTWDWVGTTDKKITFSPAVALGVEAAVVRSTDLADLRHRFAQGAAFTAETVDEAFEQVLHIAQEAAEQLQGTDFYNDLNMHGYKIKNVAAGTASGDAVNYSQLTVHDAIIVGYRDATLGFRNEAEAFADAAEASALAAASVVTAHVAELDPHTQYVLESALLAAIGVSIQAYDVATAKTNVAQNFTQPQRSALLTDNDGVFDLAIKQNFKCTTSGSITLTFSNQSDGLSGSVVFMNSSNHVVAAHANTKLVASDLAKLSTAGTYRIDYITDGTNAYCSVVGAY